jgi:hypothetical protein
MLTLFSFVFTAVHAIGDEVLWLQLGRFARGRDR